MPIDYFRLKERRFPEVRQSYREKDTMFYALALGAGQQPTHSRMLRWVYEKELEALPTMAVVLAHPGFWLKEPDSGVDWRHVLHGEQRLRVHAPLATSGEVIGTTCVKALIDKGEGKGAVVVTERTLRDAGSGGLLASIEQMTFCRADGGFAQGGRQTALTLSRLLPVNFSKALADHPEADGTNVDYGPSSPSGALPRTSHLGSRPGLSRSIRHVRFSREASQLMARPSRCH